MTIETKFSVGDIIWQMSNNRPRMGEVAEISLTRTARELTSIYKIRWTDVDGSHCVSTAYEHQMFSSKRELFDKVFGSEFMKEV